MINRQFAALRGLAIILVVLNHSVHLGNWYSQQVGFSSPTGLEYYLWLVLEQLGVFAVPIFLFVSGSFFVYAARGKDLRSAYKIVWTNLGHIVFPYVLWSLVFYILIYIWLGQSYSPVDYVKHLIVGYPFNFVPLLIFFYLLAPLLVSGGQRLSWLLLAGIGIYQYLLLNLAYPGILGFRFPDFIQILQIPVLRTTIAIWGIYFPLGVVYSLNATKLMPLLYRLRWFFLIAAVVLFISNIFRYRSAELPPLEGYLSPLFMSFLLPSIKRDQIPMAKRLELVGKRSYGLYLMHFNIINFTLFVLSLAFPALLGIRVLLIPLLFIIGLFLPLALMNSLARAARMSTYRYVFG